MMVSIFLNSCLLKLTKHGFQTNESKILLRRLLNVVFKNNESLIWYDVQNDAYFSEPSKHLLNQLLSEIVNGKPIQHIESQVKFGIANILVNSDVLIPRPETEEMSSWISDENPKAQSILDICTGSGCILIDLALKLNSTLNIGIDKSSKALDIADNNSKLNGITAQFIELDILTNNIHFNENTFDIIVSNPPYVLDSEKSDMDKNVLNFEPHMALFVEDLNPIIFYTKIIDSAYTLLAERGQLYFECNPITIHDVAEFAAERGFSIFIKEDMFGLKRFLRIRK